MTSSSSSRFCPFHHTSPRFGQSLTRLLCCAALAAAMALAASDPAREVQPSSTGRRERSSAGVHRQAPLPQRAVEARGRASMDTAASGAGPG